MGTEQPGPRSRRVRPAVAVVWVLVGLVVVLLLSGGTLLPVLRAAPEPQGPPSLPQPMAGYSYLTGPVAMSPPGPVVALWHQGFGVELMDVPQALVLSAHGDSYRRLDLAERRGGAETQGDPGPMLLSPDGRHVAVGDHAAPRTADLAVLDLTTADVRRFAVPGARSVLPVAWSADGRHVAYLAHERATTPYAGAAPGGVPGVLDLDTGVARTWDGAAEASALAFSPDGQRLAVQDRGGLRVAGLDGTPRPDALDAAGGRLAGPQSFSPDGGLLAVAREGSLAFVDATGTGRAVPAPVLPGAGVEPRVLGWTADREVVVPAAADPADGGSGDLHLLRLSLVDGQTRPLTTLPSDGNFGVGRFELAAGLLPDLRTREAGPVDRGVPGVKVLLLGAVVLAGLGWVLRGTVRAVTRTVRPSVPPGP